MRRLAGYLVLTFPTGGDLTKAVNQEIRIHPDLELHGPPVIGIDGRWSQAFVRYFREPVREDPSMWCVQCDHDLLECECPDLEERLQKIQASGLIALTHCPVCKKPVYVCRCTKRHEGEPAHVPKP